MSWVEPVGYVRLLKGVALEPGYENTIYFENASDQYDYFFHHDGISFNNYTYTRYNRGVIRIARNIKDCYKINYMMYCNDVPSSSGYSSLQKWFYCFVTEVNYIAEGTTEIVFEPDLLQTWMWDYDLGSCYVERQHTVTDAPGEYLENEGIDFGAAEYQELQPIRFNEWSVMVCTAGKPTLNQNLHYDFNFSDGGTIECGVYGAVSYTNFPCVYIDNAGNISIDNTYGYFTLLQTFFEDLTGLNYDFSNRVISVFMIPSVMASFFTGAGQDNNYQPYESTHYVEKQIPTAVHPTSYRWFYGENNNIEVKNYKLYTFPYTGLVAVNDTDSESIYPYEYFKNSPDDTKCFFGLCSALSATPECWIYPQYYRGLTNNFNEIVDFGRFPLCSWSSDSFKVWFAETNIALGRMIVNDIAATSKLDLTRVNASRVVNRNTHRSIYSENRERGKRERVGRRYSGTDANALIDNEIANTSARLNRREANALETIGTADYANEIADNLNQFLSVAGDTNFPFNPTQSNVLTMGMNLKSFRFFNFKPMKTYIEKLDSYFTRYGYALKRMMVPNLKARTRWTFVKTIGLNFTRCDMPGDVAEGIRQIFENGVTWWYASFTIDQTTGKTIDGNAPGTYDAGDNGFWGTRWQAPA